MNFFGGKIMIVLLIFAIAFCSFGWWQDRQRVYVLAEQVAVLDTEVEEAERGVRAAQQMMEEHEDSSIAQLEILERSYTERVVDEREGEEGQKAAEERFHHALDNVDVVAELESASVLDVVEALDSIGVVFMEYKASTMLRVQALEGQVTLANLIADEFASRLVSAELVITAHERNNAALNARLEAALVQERVSRWDKLQTGARYVGVFSGGYVLGQLLGVL